MMLDPSSIELIEQNVQIDKYWGPPEGTPFETVVIIDGRIAKVIRRPGALPPGVQFPEASSAAATARMNGAEVIEEG